MKKANPTTSKAQLDTQARAGFNEAAGKVNSAPAAKTHPVPSTPDPQSFPSGRAPSTP